MASSRRPSLTPAAILRAALPLPIPPASRDESGVLDLDSADWEDITAVEAAILREDAGDEDLTVEIPECQLLILRERSRL
jgi:hypothetical protein